MLRMFTLYQAGGPCMYRLLRNKIVPQRSSLRSVKKRKMHPAQTPTLNVQPNNIAETLHYIGSSNTFALNLPQRKRLHRQESWFVCLAKAYPADREYRLLTENTRL